MFGHNSRVRLNATQGNGYADPRDDFGIGLVVNASGNIVEENVVSGNTNGIYIAPTVGSNVVRDNTVVGNPAIQIGNSRPDARALDIVNLSPAGQTIFERNVCITAVNAPCPAVSRLPQ